MRGGFCNFIHRKMPTPEWEREIHLAGLVELKNRGPHPRSLSNSPEPERAVVE